MNGNVGAWICFSCMMLCAMMFIGVGIHAFRRKTPIHFWSGSEVSPDTIRDIPSYNRANGRMWCIYGSGFALFACLGLVSGAAAGIAAVVWCVAGIPALVIIYGRIHKKYKR